MSLPNTTVTALPETQKIYRMADYFQPGNKVSLFVSDCSSPEPAHRHEFIELVYILAGRGHQMVDHTVYQVNRGDLLFINYQQTHAFTPAGQLRYVNVMLDPAYLSRELINPDNAFGMLALTHYNEIRQICPRNRNLVSFQGQEQQEMETLLDFMLRASNRSSPFSTTELQGYIMAIFAKLLDKLQLLSNTATVTPQNEGWENILHYINENAQEKLTLEGLAQRCFYNPSYFSRVFKERYGLTLAAYLARVRIDRAKQLLLESDLPLAEIALQSGFGEQTALFRHFRKYCGMTPAAYRKSKKTPI
ncbi:MAG: AraC family transcriptional regulator [Oscillospiraceae bacterium]|nr:AraC family transcriptional regulator [Oscillospiraceae bacterium]MDD4368162.1 AraC family transcriptional regulator [Oscillospiraceae bacterium]